MAAFVVPEGFLFPHLAGFVVHVEGCDNAVGQLPALSKDHVLRQTVGQVGFTSATGAGQDDPSVFHQERDIALQYRLWDQRFKHQTVQTVLADTCNRKGVSFFSQLPAFLKVYFIS